MGHCGDTPVFTDLPISQGVRKVAKGGTRERTDPWLARIARGRNPKFRPLHCRRSRGQKFHYARLAAVSTFAISIATVISPTPPGTGVIAACALGGFRKRDVADEFCLALAFLGRGEPD